MAKTKDAPAYQQGQRNGQPVILRRGEALPIGEVIDELNSLDALVDRAHTALNELLHGEHGLNLADPAREIARRGIWGDRDTQ